LSVSVHAADVLYENRNVTAISRGVTYEEIRTITSAGMRDIHLLRVNITDPYISVSPVESENEHGLRETVSTLLEQSNAIAGVNADFFGMARMHSAGFGPVIRDGVLHSVSRATNIEGNEFATFFITDYNNPFISFIRTDIRFFNNGTENIRIQSINKVTDMVFPVIIDRNAMDTTALLDSQFPGLLKIVVSGDEITYISQLGETVTVPEDGYVLVIQEDSAGYFRQYFSVGQRAVLQITPQGVDFDRINTAIGGGGLILRDGEPIRMGEIPGANSRHPRTAIGINEAGTEIIMVVVDGRSHSIGATQTEMAWIMRRYGAHNAMHFDGGGSSTMVVMDQDENYNVVNTLSDGSQRRVISALGVFANAPVGQADRLIVEFERDEIWLGSSVGLSVIGMDAFGRRVNLDGVNITFDETVGSLSEGRFTPSRAGNVTVSAQHGELSASATLSVNAMAELVVNPQEIRLEVGESQNLSFVGISIGGFRYAIESGITYEVFPPDLGTAYGGVFTASRAGTGYLRCTSSHVFAYVPIYVGDMTSYGDSYRVTLPDMPRFRDPLRSEPGALTDPAVVIQGEQVFGRRAPIEYSSRQNGRFAILRMTGANGGLMSTDASQWQRFTQDLAGMDVRCIVIETDISPLHGFSEAREFQLFHEVLVSYQEQGIQVFVVSKQGLETTTRIRDGVRYINLGARWRGAETANENYRVFRVFTSGDTFTYTLTSQ